MWLDKDNIETLYAPKKRNYKKELFEAIKKFAINIAKKQSGFRKESRKILLESRKKSYDEIRDRIKTDPKVILFSTFDGRSYGDSPKAIYEYMLTQENLRIILSCGLFAILSSLPLFWTTLILI